MTQITYGYDNASQLTGITYKKSDATTVIGTLTYPYDANGQRIAIGGTLANTGHPKPVGVALYDANNRLTKLDYDGWNPIQLKNGATVVENRLTGLGPDAYYARVTGGVVQSYVTDALGSTLRLSDAAQNFVANYTYDPYGGTAGTANTNLVKYTGREQDFADLYYYRNRYYKPSIGRFISEDSIGFAGGDVNLYGYVGNEPVNFVDPLGLVNCDPWSGCGDWNGPGSGWGGGGGGIGGGGSGGFGGRIPGGSRPPNLSPPGAGRPGAFGKAKSDSGIPVSQQPSAVRPVSDSTNPGCKVWEYEFKVPGKKDPVIIQDHHWGHPFPAM